MEFKGKVWTCAGNRRHVLGQVVRNGSGIRQVLLYRNAVDLDADEPAEVDVITTLEGTAHDVRCSICGAIRTWVPGEEAIRKLLEGMGKTYPMEVAVSKGLYGKYRIEKTDGSPMDPMAMYFTLRVDTDKHARAAIRAYIESCREEQPELAGDLERLLRVVEGDQRIEGTD
jgi:hypothetical protein